MYRNFELPGVVWKAVRIINGEIWQIGNRSVNYIYMYIYISPLHIVVLIDLSATALYQLIR